MQFRTSAYAIRVNARDADGNLVLEDVPCARFQGVWAVNQIPTASLELAVGYDIKTGRPSNAYQLLEAPTGTIVEVLLYARGDSPAGGKWPETPITLWYGPKIASGADAQLGQATALITVAGWHHALTTASTLSDQFVAGGLDVLDRFLDADPTSGASTLSTSLLIFALAGLDAGIFNGVIKNVFSQVMSNVADGGRVAAVGSNSIYRKIGELTGVSLPPPDNQKALDMLFGSAPYRFHNPAEVPIVGAGGKSIHDLGLITTAGDEARVSYLAQIVRATLSDVGTASTWDKLLLIANLLGFAIFPSIKTAVFAPNVPTFANGVWRSIANATILSRATQTASAVAIGGVALIGGPLQATNYRAPKKEGAPDPANVLGAFIPDPTLQGRMLLAPAPPWLVRDVGSVTSGAQLDGRDARQSGAPYPTLGAAVAQMIWMAARFQTNTMTISAPLRLDIMPGSCLKVAQTLKSAAALYGIVNSVTVSLSGTESPEGRTDFTLSHVRPTAAIPGLLPTHPLYGTRWFGGPLVKTGPADLTAETGTSAASDTPGDTEVETTAGALVAE
jgi:hypothetical protein